MEKKIHESDEHVFFSRQECFNNIFKLSLINTRRYINKLRQEISQI